MKKLMMALVVVSSVAADYAPSQSESEAIATCQQSGNGSCWESKEQMALRDLIRKTAVPAPDGMKVDLKDDVIEAHSKEELFRKLNEFANSGKKAREINLTIGEIQELDEHNFRAILDSAALGPGTHLNIALIKRNDDYNQSQARRYFRQALRQATKKPFTKGLREIVQRFKEDNGVEVKPGSGPSEKEFGSIGKFTIDDIRIGSDDIGIRVFERFDNGRGEEFQVRVGKNGIGGRAKLSVKGENCTSYGAFIGGQSGRKGEGKSVEAGVYYERCFDGFFLNPIK